jgi:hypothetical protein
VRQIDDYVSFFLNTPLLSVYDPDPISSLRKRRISTDSHDSAASHADQRINPEQRSSSKLANNSFPTEAKAKKTRQVIVERIKRSIRNAASMATTTVTRVTSTSDTSRGVTQPHLEPRRSMTRNLPFGLLHMVEVDLSNLTKRMSPVKRVRKSQSIKTRLMRR